MKNNLKNSLNGKMLMLSVLPIFVLAVIVGIISFQVFNAKMTDSMEDSLKNHAQAVKNIYEKMYPGDYSIEVISDDKYNLYKGGYKISGDSQTLDSFKRAYNIDVTLFCKDVSVLTTMYNETGARQNLSKAPTKVVSEVLNTRNAKFYKNVKIDSESYYAYYEPVILSNGDVFGMLGICVPSISVRRSVMQAVLPIIGIVILSAVIIGAISVWYSREIIDRIKKIQKFMHTLAKGEFDVNMPDRLMNIDDELGDLAKSGTKMQKALSQLVEMDPLTQLHNRRYGTAKFTKVKERAEFANTSYCVGICDIDFFKKVNDTYGHDAGDEVLKAVAGMLKKHFGGKGTIARWGGEEFLVVFEKTTIEEALDIINAMLDDVRAMEVPYNDQIIKVTMSMGIVQADNKASEEEMLKAADELLYYSKTNGRNQVNYDNLSVHLDK